MKVCTHTLAERWDDCSDGACPFCLADRIRELEAEREELFKAGAFHQERAYAIRAKTIEECVEIVEPYGFGPTSMMVTEIRALAQSSTSAQPFEKPSGDEAKPT